MRRRKGRMGYWSLDYCVARYLTAVRVEEGFNVGYAPP